MHDVRQRKRGEGGRRDDGALHTPGTPGRWSSFGWTERLITTTRPGARGPGSNGDVELWRMEGVTHVPTTLSGELGAMIWTFLEGHPKP